jgi:hypothetical protein
MAQNPYDAPVHGQSTPFIATYTQNEIYNLVKKSFSDFMEKYPADAKPMFIVDPAPAYSGTIHRYMEKDFSTFAQVKPEGVASKRAKKGIGYHKDITLKRIALEISLSWEAVRFSQWDDVRNIGTQLGKTVPQRINLDMTQFAVTFAQGTSYTDMSGYQVDTTTGDGLSLANAAHTLAFSAATYTNICPGGLQFSKSALIANEIIGRNNTVDNYNIPSMKKFTHIFSSGDAQVKYDIAQFLRSITDNTQANPSVINPLNNRYQHLVLEQLDTDVYGQRDTTKSKWWGIGAFEGRDASQRFPAYYREWEAPHMKPAPTEDNNASDFSRDIMLYGARAGYNVCALNGTGIVYNFPTNS